MTDRPIKTAMFQNDKHVHTDWTFHLPKWVNLHSTSISIRKKKSSWTCFVIYLKICKNCKSRILVVFKITCKSRILVVFRITIHNVGYLRRWCDWKCFRALLLVSWLSSCFHTTVSKLKFFPFFFSYKMRWKWGTLDAVQYPNGPFCHKDPLILTSLCEKIASCLNTSLKTNLNSTFSMDLLKLKM